MKFESELVDGGKYKVFIGDYFIGEFDHPDKGLEHVCNETRLMLDVRLIDEPTYSVKPRHLEEYIINGQLDDVSTTYFNLKKEQNV